MGCHEKGRFSVLICMAGIGHQQYHGGKTSQNGRDYDRCEAQMKMY